MQTPETALRNGGSQLRGHLELINNYVGCLQYLHSLTGVSCVLSTHGPAPFPKWPGSLSTTLFVQLNIKPKHYQVDAQRQKASLQKRLAGRRQAADAIVAAAWPVSQQAAEKTAALADFTEEAERNALETSLLDETSRIQSEADAYERLVQGMVTSAEEAASAAEAAGAAGVPQAGAESAAEEASESLRAVHERAVAAMEVQHESKRRTAAGKLAQRRAAAKAAKAEALRAAGKTEEEIAKQLTEVSSLHTVRLKARGWEKG